MFLVIERPDHIRRLDDNHLEITCSDGHIGVSVVGELDDCNTGRLRECLCHAMDDGMHDIVLDIAKVTHMDSRALAVVLAVHRRMEEVGGTFVICGATPLNVRLFNAAGLAFCLSDWQGDRVVPMGYRAYPGDTSHKCLVYGSTVRTDGAGRAAAGGVLI